MSTLIYDAVSLDIYDEFLKQNSIFWESFSPVQSQLEDKVILVDLMCEHVQYLITNLFVAKYLQKHTNAQLIGIMRHPSVYDQIAPLTDSFSVNEVVWSLHNQISRHWPVE